MCKECGCGEHTGSGYRINGRSPSELNEANGGHVHSHDHDHVHEHDHDHAHHHHDHGGLAEANAARFAAAGSFAIDVIGAPGAGKTALIAAAAKALADRAPLVAILDERQSGADENLVAKTGAVVIRAGSDESGRLDAHALAHALEHVDLPAAGVVFIESVEDLVRPAVADLGEAVKVAVVAATDGAETPVKYPDLFAAADLLLINKADLAGSSTGALLAAALTANPLLQTLVVSAFSGDGLGAFVAWIEARAATARANATRSAA